MTPGIFETMRAADGEVALLSAHLARLRTSAVALGLACPDDVDLERKVRGALADGGAYRLRLDLGPSGDVRTAVAPMPENRPVRLARISGYDPVGPARHKLRDRPDYEQAAAAAIRSGADHPLLVSSDAQPGETDHANLFAVIDGQLVTPPRGGILPGIARALIIERLGARETAISATALERAAEVFLTNALRGVIVVTAIDGQPCSSGALARAATTVLQ